VQFTLIRTEFRSFFVPRNTFPRAQNINLRWKNYVCITASGL